MPLPLKKKGKKEEERREEEMTTNDDQDVGQRNPYTLLAGIETGATTMTV